MQHKLIAGAFALALTAPAAATAQTVTLNVSSWVPPSHLINVGVIAPLCKDIEAATARGRPPRRSVEEAASHQRVGGVDG